MKIVAVLFFLLNSICLFSQSKFGIIPKIGIGTEVNSGSDKVFYLPFTGEIQAHMPLIQTSFQAYYYRTLSNNFDQIPNVRSYDASAAIVIGKAPASLLIGGFYSYNNRSYGIDYDIASGNEYDYNSNPIFIQNMENGKEWTQTSVSEGSSTRVHFTKALPYYGAGLGFKSISPSEKNNDYITIMIYYFWAPKLNNLDQTIIRSPFNINVPIEYNIQGLKYHYTGFGLDMKYNFYQFGLNLRMGTKPNIYIQDPNGDKLKRFERAFNMSLSFFISF